MMASYVVRLASKNMWRHRLRTGLTMAGIAVAIVSFGLLRTVVDSWYAGAELSSSARLITRAEASLSFSLPVTYGDTIDVSTCSVSTSFDTYLSLLDGCPLTTTGATGASDFDTAVATLAANNGALPEPF